MKFFYRFMQGKGFIGLSRDLKCVIYPVLVVNLQYEKKKKVFFFMNNVKIFLSFK